MKAANRKRQDMPGMPGGGFGGGFGGGGMGMGGGDGGGCIETGPFVK